jgi:hypothetical protein
MGTTWDAVNPASAILAPEMGGDIMELGCTTLIATVDVVPGTVTTVLELNVT